MLKFLFQFFSFITEPVLDWLARRDSSSRIRSTIEVPIGFEEGIDASVKGTVGFVGFRSTFCL